MTVSEQEFFTPDSSHTVPPFSLSREKKRSSIAQATKMPGRERGWVAVSVRTYHSHRLQQNQPQNQRVVQQDYTVDETGATLNAVSRSSDMREEERIMAQMATASANQATTSIFIRDWKLSGRRAYIRYERDDNSFWFNPVVDEHRPSSSTPGFPCNRGDIFLKLGMRGARLIPWRLREGDVFRLGQAYVLVAKVRTAADVAMDVSALQPFEAESRHDMHTIGDDGDDSEGEGDEARLSRRESSKDAEAPRESPPAAHTSTRAKANENLSHGATAFSEPFARLPFAQSATYATRRAKWATLLSIRVSALGRSSMSTSTACSVGSSRRDQAQ